MKVECAETPLEIRLDAPQRPEAELQETVFLGEVLLVVQVVRLRRGATGDAGGSDSYGRGGGGGACDGGRWRGRGGFGAPGHFVGEEVEHSVDIADEVELDDGAQ